MHLKKDLSRTIAAFYDRLRADAHHRYRSWEHCFRYFRSKPREELVMEKTTAALQMGFYLASWGMYRVAEQYDAADGVVDVAERVFGSLRQTAACARVALLAAKPKRTSAEIIEQARTGSIAASSRDAQRERDEFRP